MEMTLGASVLLISYLYLSGVTSPVSGKCYGKWAIHACFGGNGKRSDPNFENTLLNRLLTSSAQKLSTFQDENPAPSEEDLNVLPYQYEDSDDGFKDAEEDSYPGQTSRSRPEIRDFIRHLQALRLQEVLSQKDPLLI